jgi:predicted DNA binding protein
MLITDLTIAHPILGASLHRLSGVKLEWQETYTQQDRPTQMLFWVEGDSFDAVESAIAEATMVENPTVFAQLDDRRLYRVDFNDEGSSVNLMGEFMQVGAVLEAARGDDEGWHCRIRFPTREAYHHVYDFCTSHDITVHIDRVWERRAGEPGDGLSMTDAQRETLMAAVESGYLDIPRGCSLEELGEQLGISRSATSERFRRGVKNLVLESL